MTLNDNYSFIPYLHIIYIPCVDGMELKAGGPDTVACRGMWPLLFPLHMDADDVMGRPARPNPLTTVDAGVTAAEEFPESDEMEIPESLWPGCCHEEDRVRAALSG